MDIHHYDIIIVGAGLSGATFANLAANDEKKVLVIDQRNHIAGNCYDFIDPLTKIRASKYGAHIFHTNNEEVWNYVQQFGEWKRWEHRVLTECDGMLVPIPVNPTTVNMVLNKTIATEEEMKEWLDKERGDVVSSPSNSEEIAINRVGKRLYEKLFKEYTYKQWAKYPNELDPSVLARIPVRTTFDTRYFSDKYQALPVDGYTSIVDSMLNHPNITVMLNTSWETFKVYAEVHSITWASCAFTGPIDEYFKSRLGPLEYRSIEFEWIRKPMSGYMQPNSVVNYAQNDKPYTRCIEYKHFLNQKSDWSVFVYEYPCSDGEPYYPVPTAKNQELYEQYKQLAEEEKKRGYHFIGRLANYKYFNMDQAIRNAMDYYRKYFCT